MNGDDFFAELSYHFLTLQDIHIHRAISCAQQIVQSLVVSCTLENFGVVKYSLGNMLYSLGNMLYSLGNITYWTGNHMVFLDIFVQVNTIVSMKIVLLLHSVCHCLCIVINVCCQEQVFAK